MFHHIEYIYLLLVSSYTYVDKNIYFLGKHIQQDKFTCTFNS